MSMKRVSMGGLIVLASLMVASVYADVVELTTGQRVEGSFKQASEGRVSIEVGGQIITFEQEKVRAIYLGVAPPVTSGPSAASEALRALKALQSVVQGGVGYREYATRVNDAKIQVDRYVQLGSLEHDPSKAAMAAAMGYYVVASSSWNSAINRRAADLPGVEGVPLEECRHLWTALPPPKDAAVAQDHKKRREFAINALRGMSTIGQSYQPQLWSCASEKIAEAERLATR